MNIVYVIIGAHFRMHHSHAASGLPAIFFGGLSARLLSVLCAFSSIPLYYAGRNPAAFAEGMPLALSLSALLGRI